MAAFYEFRLISAIVGLFQNAKARQFHAFQHVLNQVRLVRDPLLQMRSAEELLEFRTQLQGAFDFGLRAETKAAFGQLDILVLMTRPSSKPNCLIAS